MEARKRRHEYGVLVAACNLWNSLTKPTFPKTEQRHAMDSELARHTMNYIQSNWTYGVHYVELSGGHLYPAPPNSEYATGRPPAVAGKGGE